jgi:hypothetical protein
VLDLPVGRLPQLTAVLAEALSNLQVRVATAFGRRLMV